MTITFENDNDVIVYALEKIIAYARRTQQIFVAQCIWWIASILGLEQGLVLFIDNIQSRVTVTIIPEEVPRVDKTISPIPRDNQEDLRQDKILEECEEYLKDSRRLREIAALKATGKTLTGLINPTAISKKNLRKKDRHLRKPARIPEESRIAGISDNEVQRRRSAGECLRCAWPFDRKGNHRVADCRRPIKLAKGTATLPKTKEYQKKKQLLQQPTVGEESSEGSRSEGSTDSLS
jgi:hypothetical protein